ncbi:MAG: UbiA family prenyltransferase [Phycisphaerales bacterium]
MRRALLRIAPVLHLTRVTTAFAVVANTWFVILWTRANAEHEPGVAALPGPLAVTLLAGALVALGLFVFGSALNDILDVKRDRMLHPERPLASGELSREGAVAMVVLAATAAVLGATAFGIPAVLLTLMLILAILLFNAAGKFIPAIGLVVLGLIYGGHMAVPNVGLRFLWPVWFVMTHALAVGLLTHRMARKVPRLSRRALIAAVGGWVFWSAVLFVIQWRRGGGDGTLWPAWVNPWGIVWPLLVAAAFALVVWDRVRRYGYTGRAADKIGRYGALWLGLYACSWLIGDGHWGEALLLAGLAAAGFLGMTVLRELYGLVEEPMRYRR